MPTTTDPTFPRLPTDDLRWNIELEPKRTTKPIRIEIRKVVLSDSRAGSSLRLVRYASAKDITKAMQDMADDLAIATSVTGYWGAGK